MLHIKVFSLVVATMIIWKTVLTVFQVIDSTYTLIYSLLSTLSIARFVFDKTF